MKILKRLSQQNPVATQLLVLLVVASTLTAGAFLLVATSDVTWEEIRSAAPAISSVIAALTFALTGFAVSTAVVRQRRERTIDAWHAWQEDRAKDRKFLAECLGPDALTSTQAAQLRRPPSAEFHGYGGVVLDAKRAVALRDALVRTLNGLERLAVGCELGIYDKKTLGLLANRIITRTVHRYDHYLEGARQLNPQAYKPLKALDAEFRRVQSKE